MTTSSELQLAITAAKKAGEIIRQAFGKTHAIEDKKSKGIVTETDKKSEEAIFSILKDSNYPILSEESGLVGRKSNVYWVVDPLDGTTDFSHGFPFFFQYCRAHKKQPYTCRSNDQSSHQ